MKAVSGWAAAWFVLRATVPKRLLVAAAVVALAASGCAAQPGRAVKAAGGPPVDVVDPSLLSTGNLTVRPSAPLGAAGSWQRGAAVESRRLADIVVGPWDVDPSLIVPGPARALVFRDAASLTLFEPGSIADAARGHGLVSGFASDRLGADGRRLVNAALVFPDPTSARAAALDMTAVMEGSTTSVPHHPEVRASADPPAAGRSPQTPITLYAFTSHGSFVSCQVVSSTPLDDAITLLARTLDVQTPRLDAFSPADAATIAGLPLDPTGLLAHTMAAQDWPVEDTNPANPKIGLYTPYAALHFQDDPPAAAAAFARAGLRSMAYDAATVYQARDADGATVLATDLADLALRTSPDAKQVDSVDFMPGSRCVQFDHGRDDSETNECFAAIGTYALQIRDDDLINAHQKTAAQYEMLQGF